MPTVLRTSGTVSVRSFTYIYSYHSSTNGINFHSTSRTQFPVLSKNFLANFSEKTLSNSRKILVKYYIISFVSTSEFFFFIHDFLGFSCYLYLYNEKKTLLYTDFLCLYIVNFKEIPCSLIQFFAIH